MKRDYTGESYYDMPAVKPTPFGWHVGVYLFVSGLAGGAALIASVAERFGASRLRSVVRNGRYLAFAGALASPVLLINDLKTPRRWYNMLRIFRRTSPMSIGSYILGAFGATSSAAALAELVRARHAAHALSVPAAAAGAGMLTYTGALLSSTSTPLWAAESPLMSARLASSGIASGAAALSLFETLAGRPRNAAALDRLAFTASATYAAVTHHAHAQAHAAEVAAPMEEGTAGALYDVGSALCVAVPIACHVLNLFGWRRSRTLSIAAAVSTLAGAAITRYAELQAGKASAKRPQDYLRYTSTDERA